jgi:ATP-dependent helicase HrpB
MVGGVGVRLAPESGVRQHEFFIALDPRQDERNPAREAIVRIASGIDIAWLEEMFPHEVRRERRPVYDEQRDRVVGHGVIRYRDLPLREDKDAAVDDETAEHVLRDHLTTARAWKLLLDDEHAAGWIMRLQFLSAHMPDAQLPTLNDDTIRQLVADAVIGKRSLAQVRPALLGRLQGLLDYRQNQLLQTEAPETIAVPTGNRIKLDYTSIRTPPVLAVRLQEMFGMTQTPRIAAGRVAVQLHLLGPNFRPVQITDDLQSFWKTTYFQVRKDLRVRYPKHSWPDDPLTAAPQAKGGRRR